MIFDTHAHYDDKAFDEDREELLGSLREQGIEYVVNVGASLRGARESVALSSRYGSVYAAVGIHPDEIGCLNDQVLEELRGLCLLGKTVAVGEIGLDYHWNRESRQMQREGFIRQLHLAREVDLPINVHSRDASQETLEIIRSEHAGSTGGVIHCFSGSLEIAREYVRMGYYLGIGGVVTFKNARVLKEVVKDIPLEYLVTETDCPYLAPEPHRGQRNSSLYLPQVVKEIAAIKGLTEDRVEDVMFENAKNLYRL